MNKKLREILTRVVKPSRYVGGEWNQNKKDFGAIPVRYCLAFPDVYEVGMSHLGLKIIYHEINRREDALAERVYTPWPDMEKELRAAQFPLYGLESFHALKEYDLIGFALLYEMNATNILTILDLAQIPLRASDRGEDEPIILAGGPCVSNMESMADFFDLAILGEGEEIIHQLTDVFRTWKEEGKPGGKKEFLLRAAQLQGIYVPSFYEPIYDAKTGIVKEIKALAPNISLPVKKSVVKDMDALTDVTKPVVPFLLPVHDRIHLEIFRGCTRGCRFCQAGMIYRPVRERSPENLIETAKKIAANTGYDEAALMSLSSADYSCLPELVEALQKELKEQRVNVSLPSLRLDSFSVDLAKKVQAVRKSGLTFAPEAGSQRLRDVINKGVTEEDLVTALSAAFSAGWSQVKLYFMIGLPTETDEDIVGIIETANRVVDLYRSIKGKGNIKVTVSVSSFVPKAHTPFQWFPQNTKEELERKQSLLRSTPRAKAISLQYHDARISHIEAIFSRGDRTLSKLIEAAWKRGARFDGWTEWFRYDIWMDTIRELGIDDSFYARRIREFDEVLPWDHLSVGVEKRYLLSEWNQAVAAQITEDCRLGACGACGVCPNLDVEIIDKRRDKNANA